MAVIRRLSNGTYQLDTRHSGKRERISFRTKALAEEALLRLKMGRVEQSSIEPKSIKDAIRFYFENISAKKASRENEKAYLERLYKFLRQKSVVMVHEVTPMLLEEFRTERKKRVVRGKPITNATVNREFNTYRHFFNKCVAWKATEKSPCEAVDTLPAQKNTRRPWTDDEFKQVVTRSPRWVGDVLRAIYMLGAGPTELSRVTWQDIDWERRSVLVRRFKGDGSELQRFLPIPPEYFADLEAKRRLANGAGFGGPQDFVWTNSRGNRIDARPLAKEVRLVARKLGLPQGTVSYGLRHKFATELLEAGVGEDIVRRLMGHRSVRTLIENYSHVRDGVLRDAMDVREFQARRVKASKKT